MFHQLFYNSIIKSPKTNTKRDFPSQFFLPWPSIQKIGWRSLPTLNQQTLYGWGVSPSGSRGEEICSWQFFFYILQRCYLTLTFDPEYWFKIIAKPPPMGTQWVKFEPICTTREQKNTCMLQTVILHREVSWPCSNWFKVTVYMATVIGWSLSPTGMFDKS